MKKLLAGLSIAAVLASAFLAGLAVLPHTHGDDVDHSHHENCPVYLKSFQSIDGLAPAAAFWLAFALCAAFFVPVPALRPARIRAASSSRAPPRSR